MTGVQTCALPISLVVRFHGDGLQTLSNYLSCITGKERERSVLGIVETEYLYLNQPCYVSERKGILIYTILQ